jgi:hypothetical protein
MPVDLPERKKPNVSAAISIDQWIGRPLNLLAIIIGLGLCFWAFNFGITSPAYVNSPSSIQTTVPLNQ